MSMEAASHAATVSVDHRRLHRLLCDCFTGVGLDLDDASAVANVLVDANLSGIESHGVERAPIYMRRVAEGLAQGTGQARVLLDAGAVCRIDAAHALGPAISTQAVDRVVTMARSHGVGVVAVGCSTHFGHAGFYVRRAADQGMISLAASNAPATMTPHGATDPFLGANPMAIGIPLDGDRQFVLDMSTSVIARGRIRRAQALGTELEYGTAVDAGGKPTTDPSAALAGAVLPMAGAKGSGLAMAINLMAGVLAGADFDDEMESMYSSFERPHNIGHLFWAIDPECFGDPTHARRRTASLVERLHALTPVGGADGVMFPGERQQACRAERTRGGIPVAAVELQRLREEAAVRCLATVVANIDEIVGTTDPG